MYKLYFKQALWMLKQNKFISTIAIMGTALAIMMIMSIIVADEIKNISVAPEINRDRMLYINYQVERDTVIGSWRTGAVSYQIYHDYLESMKNNNTYCTVLLLAKNKYDFPAIFAEVRNIERKYASERTEEIGIRKAFGANKYTILLQVLFENLITSLIGGLVGLLLSYIVVFRMRDWLLDVPTGSAIPVGTLISFPVLLAVFAVCILINLLSAGIPAYKASRMNIISAI